MRRTTVVLLVAYGTAVLFVVAWPKPVDAGSRGLIDRVLEWLHRHGLPGFVGYDLVEFVANVALFVPLAFLVAVLFGLERWWLAAFLCATLSVVIELYQYALLPDRYATVDDVIANSMGSLIGATFAFVLLRRRRLEIARQSS